jgi:polysaccharide export outer membrane protein
MRNLLTLGKLLHSGRSWLFAMAIVALLAVVAAAQTEQYGNDENGGAYSGENDPGSDSGYEGGAPNSPDTGQNPPDESTEQSSGQYSDQYSDQYSGQSEDQSGEQAQPNQMPIPAAQPTPWQGQTEAPNTNGNFNESGAPAGFNESGAATGAAASMATQLSPSAIAELKARLSSGPLTADDLQQLCAQMAAKHMTAEDLQELSQTLSLNLTPEQQAQLESCTQLNGPENPAQPRQRAQVRRPLSPTARNARPLRLTPQPALSSIEKAFRGLDLNAPPQQPSPQGLLQYGYSLFNRPVSTFAPGNNLPVSSDYLVGPGDELKVLMWGRINHSYDLQVDRSGAIAIPGIGPIQVAGLTFAEAKKLIEERAGQITGVQVDLTMGRLRTIQVFVIGEVNHPGPYTVSSLSHVSNALVACGGVTKIGSLRRIELRRGNQLVKVFDLYDLLMHGDTAADEQLQPGDVIFVPVIGPVVAMIGGVKRPAIYELRSSPADLPGVLNLAGGESPFGYSRRIQVERIENHTRRVVLDTDLDQVRSSRFAVSDGDLIRVFSVLPQQNDIVTVKGNVYRPGKYQWHPGMKVADVVREAEGIAPRTFMRYAMIRRQEDENRVVHIVPVDLDSAIADQFDANLTLEPKDILTVYKLDQIRDLPTVQVFGEVRNPGFYATSPDMRVSDLVYLAGGLKDDAYLAKAEVARTEVINGSSTRHSYMDLDLRAALKGSADHNLKLETNDQLFVWRASNWHLPWVVQIKGQVLRPGPYTFHEGEHLASVLERCGGMLPDAYLPATVFIRRSIKQLEQTSLDESRARLRKQIAQVQLMPKQVGETDESRNAQALGGLEQVLEQSEGEGASGRMVVHLRPLDELTTSQDNVLLEDQDQIVIPRRPSAVSVLGQVYHPTALVYQPELTLRDYLDRAGGPTEGADEDHIYVFKADGSILTDDGLKNGSKAKMFPLLPVFSGGLMSAYLEPGDVVYVPEQLVFSNNLEVVKDVSQIIASAIQTIAVVALVATTH